MSKYYKSELTVSYESNSRTRNFFGIAISILVLMLISSMIVAAIVIINPEIGDLLDAQPARQREAISLEESLLDGLEPVSFSSQWLASQNPANGALRDELLYEDSKNLQLLNVELAQPGVAAIKGQPNTLLSNGSLLASVESQGFRLSPSRRYLLIWNSKRRQFRHSFTARYYIYDIRSDQILMLSTTRQSVIGQEHSDESIEEDQLPAFGNTYESLDTAANYLNSRSELDGQPGSSRFQAVDWFTDEHSNDGLILIQANDIYVATNLSGPEIRPERLTRSGREGEIFNGLPDWLYEEEILADTPAYQVNPDGRSLAYMSFNDSQVELIQFPTYGPPIQTAPQIQRIRYPKAGKPNPIVSVHVLDDWHLPSRRPIQLELPQELAQRQHYINRIKWLNKNKLALIWLSRNQNRSCIVVCSREEAWKCNKNLELEAPGGWLDMTDDIVPLDDESYLMIVPRFVGHDVGAFKHVAKVEINKLNSFTYLTAGCHEVLSIEGLDQKANALYYSSSVPGQPGQRQMYATKLAPTSSPDQKAEADICVTCSHYPEECLYNYVKLSPTANYYLFECEGPGVPRVELRSIKPLDTPRQQLATNQSASAADTSATTLLWSIEENQQLRYKLEQQRMMPVTLRLKVPIAGANYSADVLMLLPPELSPSTSFRLPDLQVGRPSLRTRRSAVSSGSRSSSAGKQRAFWRHLTEDTMSEYIEQLAGGQQWPMVVDVYAGPGSQKVDFRYNINFGHYLSSSRRAVYAMIDGRGSGNQGTKRLFELYHKFGTVEIEDQIEVSRWLAHRLPFVDKHKVAIWGWSYGGYAAAMALAQSSEPSQVASEGSSSKLLAPEVSSEFQRPQPTAGGGGGRRLVSRFKGPQLADGVFECAASVAPVTNWIYYDTAYTERYMSSPYANEIYDDRLAGDHGRVQNESRKPQNVSSHADDHHQRNLQLPWSRWAAFNETLASGGLRNQPNGVASEAVDGQLSEHYKAASLLEQIPRIERKKFLLIHGTADDNVHFQQSIQLMKKMISRNILFETRVYPDQDHGIVNRADKLHLGFTLSNFFDECFNSPH